MLSVLVALSCLLIWLMPDVYNVKPEDAPMLLFLAVLLAGILDIAGVALTWAEGCKK